MNGKVVEEVRSVWSAKDEGALRELLERKERIMATHKDRLGNVVKKVGCEGADALEGMIRHAEELRDALAPFDGRPT